MIRPKSARLPVTKQILRLCSLIAGPDAGAGRKVDQAALDRFGGAESGIQVGQTVIEADLVMHEGPFVRQLRGGGEMLGAAPQFLVIGQDGTAAAGGDDLVAVEAQRREPRLGSDGVTLVGRAQR